MTALATFWNSLVRWQKNTVILACVLTVHALFGFALLPHIIRHVLVEKVSPLLNRQVRVDEIRCNPFALTLDLRGLSVADKDGSGEFIGLDGLHADLQLSSLWRLAIVLRDIRLDGPRLHVRLDENGQPNFADLTAGSDQSQEPSTPLAIPLIVEPFTIDAGLLSLKDQTHDATHVVDQISFRVPRFSSRKKDWETFMTPTLSFRINGAPFTLQGRTIPFHDSLKTQFDLDVADLDLPRYWPYVPAAKDLKLARGMLTLNASLTFEHHEGGLPALSLHGRLVGQGLELTDQERVVLAVPRAEVVMEDLSILNQRLALKSVTLDKPFLHVARRPDGTLNWAGYFGPPEPPAQNATAAENPDSNATLMFLARETRITDGRIEFRDESAAFAKELRNLTLTLTDLSTAPNATTQASLSLDTGQDEKLQATAAFSLTPFALTAAIDAKSLDAPSYAPYFKAALPLELTSAKVDAQGSLALPGNGGGPRLDNTTVSVRDLALNAPDNAGGVRARRIGLDKISVDLATRAVHTGLLGVEGVRVTTAVDSKGRARIMEALHGAPAASQTSGQPNDAAKTNGWTVKSAGAAISDLTLATTNGVSSEPFQLKKLNIGPVLVDTGARTAAVGPVDLAFALNLVLQKNGADLAALFGSDQSAGKAKAGKNEAAWNAAMERITISGSALGFTDETLPKPMRLNVDQLALSATNLSTDLSKPIPLSLSCRVEETGAVQAGGNLTPASLTGQGDITLSKLPVSLASAYMADVADIGIAAGHLGGKLNWRLEAKGAGQITGDLRLDDLRVTEGRSAAEIAGWRSLSLRGVALRLAPLSVRVGRVDLAAPKGALVIDKQGKTTLDRINPAAKPKAAPRTASGQGGLKSLDIGPVTIKQGRFSFADKTLSPQFESVIAPLDLTMSGFSLDPTKRSDLNLTAVIDGSAPITVTGWISPLQTPLAANGAITLRNLDLVALSPYSSKFIAYPVTRGQLDWDMRIGAENSSLAMGNSITARQLELGDKAPSPTAADVPVKLGLALLRDMAGNVAINLPVKGDLNDPKFSIGGIVMQAFLGLIVKAIASPFSLLASLIPNGGGQDDPGKLPFPPGQAAPAPEIMPTMQRLANILAQRPGLNISIVGRAAMDADRHGLEDLQFRRKLQVIKYEDLPRREREKSTVEAVEITDEEYADLLWAAYKEEPVDKEKNAIGLHKDVPREVQEAKLRELIRVTDEDLVRLAGSRAEFVRDYLVRELKIDQNRVVLGHVGPEALSSAAEVVLEVRQ